MTVLVLPWCLIVLLLAETQSFSYLAPNGFVKSTILSGSCFSRSTCVGRGESVFFGKETHNGRLFCTSFSKDVDKFGKLDGDTYRFVVGGIEALADAAVENTPNTDKVRLDAFLSAEPALVKQSRTWIAELCVRELVSVNGKPRTQGKFKVKRGDIVEIRLMRRDESSVDPEVRSSMSLSCFAFCHVTS